jgi:hypothetical protein
MAGASRGRRRRRRRHETPPHAQRAWRPRCGGAGRGQAAGAGAYGAPAQSRRRAGPTRRAGCGVAAESRGGEDAEGILRDEACSLLRGGCRGDPRGVVSPAAVVSPAMEGMQCGSSERMWRPRPPLQQASLAGILPPSFSPFLPLPLSLSPSFPLSLSPSLPLILSRLLSLLPPVALGAGCREGIAAAALLRRGDAAAAGPKAFPEARIVRSRSRERERARERERRGKLLGGSAPTQMAGRR